PPRPHRPQVVSLSSPIVGLTIRDSHFRSRYGAVVLAVHRNGERITGGLGDIVVKGGDTMLLEAGPAFLERYKNSSEWALAVDAFRVAPPRRDPFALFTSLTLFVAMILLNRQVAVGGRRLVVGGLAERIAASLLSGFHWLGAAGPVTVVYVTTSLLTALLSNGAAVTLMWPVARDLAKQAGINIKGPLYALMVGASSDFSTPIGYQTNLMVSGPGGYRFLDYTRFGLPLQLISGLITVPICVKYFQ
ncbi:putative sulfur deprivation response regulator, partial [Tetrabaena socialis]